MSKLQKIGLSVLVAVAFPALAFAQLQATTGLQYGDIPVVYNPWVMSYSNATLELIDNNQLKLQAYIQNYTYYPDNCFVYHIQWNYKTKKRVNGSISINDKVWKDQAYTEFEKDTGCWFIPGETYKITFWSAANGKGKKLFEGSFTAPPVAIDNVSY